MAGDHAQAWPSRRARSVQRGWRWLQL